MITKAVEVKSCADEKHLSSIGDSVKLSELKDASFQLSLLGFSFLSLCASSNSFLGSADDNHFGTRATSLQAGKRGSFGFSFTTCPIVETFI
jgi:hypothetical protein